MASPKTIAMRREREEARRRQVRVTQSGMITVHKMHEVYVETLGKTIMKRKPYVGLRIADAQHLELFYDEPLTDEDKVEIDKGFLPHWWKMQLEPLFAQSCEYMLHQIALKKAIVVPVTP